MIMSDSFISSAAKGLCIVEEINICESFLQSLREGVALCESVIMQATDTGNDWVQYDGNTVYVLN